MRSYKKIHILVRMIELAEIAKIRTEAAEDVPDELSGSNFYMVTIGAKQNNDKKHSFIMLLSCSIHFYTV